MVENESIPQGNDGVLSLTVMYRHALSETFQGYFDDELPFNKIKNEEENISPPLDILSLPEKDKTQMKQDQLEACESEIEYKRNLAELAIDSKVKR